MRTQMLRTKLLQPLRILLSLSLVLQVLLPAAAVTTYASSVTSAVFSGGAGTVSVGGTLYAKNGGALTLTVITSTDTMCVDVTGAFTGHQQSSTAKTTWTFTFTAGAGDGAQTVTASAMPNVNNNNKCTGTSGSGTASYTLDNTGPTITAALLPLANAAGWNNSNVSITWSATDAGSGVASGPNPASENENQNGSSSHTSTATDRLGNTGTGSVTVKLDKMNPTISASRAPAANANGWNNTDVIASFACADAPSGIKTCTSPTTLTASGANQSVTGTAVDNADNSASATVSGISIDKTAPTLTGTPTTSANVNGWYSANVIIHWTASDALSGLATAVPADSTISGEGSGLTATASISDKAGNTTTANSAPVNIDRTAPNTTSNASGNWQKANFTVTLAPTDSLSGVASTFYKLDGGAQQTGASVSISSEGDHTLDFWSVDKAGNVEATKTAHVKLDKTAPTITHTQSPAANANGWNNGDVNVAFNCSDALSGIASCTGPATVSAETAGQVVNGTATDNAANTATDSVTVKLDKIAPTLTGAPTSNPNGAGWYNTAVAIHWVCADSLSGLAAACPPDSTISSEGTGLTASASVSDQAGNTTNATSSPAARIDKTAPNTTATAPTNWNNTDVTVSLNAADGLSGVASTFYKLDGAAPQSGVSVPISAEGIHTLEFWSVDNAGNQEASKTVQVKIDKTPPTINHSQAPAANGNGWNNTNVTVTFSCSDALSGIASCTSAQTVTTEGKDEPVTGTAVDNANNSATDPATVSIDETAPTISAAADRAKNANGWYQADVSVSFTCADPAPSAGITPSGVTSCAPAQTFHEGGNQSASGSVSDAAGNAGNTSLNGINVDKTDPSLGGTPTTGPNAAGWYGGNVTVHWTCSDVLSGIDGSCPPDATLSGEGSALTTTASVSDRAGNTTGADSAPAVNIDRTAPTINGHRAPDANPNGWNNANVTVSFTCADALSGVASCTGPQTIATEGNNQSVSGNASDNAGHTASATVGNINFDKTPPTISATADRGANANDWYNADVVVSFSCSDALSGITACPVAATLNEGANQTSSGTTGDLAGNSASASVTGVNIDKTAPSLSGVATTSPNGNGWYNSDVTIHWTASDALSGLAGAAPSDSPITGEGDSLSASATVSDKADNSSNASVSGIKIDRTAPHTSVNVPAPLASGWYAGAVPVTLTGVDYLSGIATTSYSVDGGTPQAYSGPFNHNVRGVHTLTFWSADTAGNVEDNAAASNTIIIKIDDIAPSTGAASVPSVPDGNNYYYKTAVDITLTASDAESGVAATYYTIDGDTPQSYAGVKFTVQLDGPHTVTYWSVDNAGNVENPAAPKNNVLNFAIDATPPTIVEKSRTPGPNPNGWNNTAVTVSFTCADATSGTASCADLTFNNEGASQKQTATATDNAGNSASLLVSNVNIDKTNPTLAGAATTNPNAFGWYKSDVTIHWTGQDGLSGIDPGTQPPDSVITGQGSNLGAGPVSISDKAGNTGSASVGGIKIDRTPPTITGANVNDDGTARTANAAGWFNSAVRVRFTCSDTLSYVQECGSDVVLNSDGANQSAIGTATDKADNSATTNKSGINIDSQAPSTTVGLQCTGKNGYCRVNLATVALSATDQTGLSGVKEIHYSTNSGFSWAVAAGGSTTVNLTLNGSGRSRVLFYAVDNAGNSESTGGVDVKWDTIAPTVTHTLNPAANATGWDNANTTVHFDAVDDSDGSGVDLPTVTPDQTISVETAGQVVSGSAYDLAGNKGTDSATVKLDKTAPTITGAATTSPNANGWYASAVTVHFTCADLGTVQSGIAQCPADVVLSTDGASQSATGTASDKAGNTANTTVSGIDIDSTKPTITSMSLTNGAVYTLGDAAVPSGTPTCIATDGGSGVASCTVTVTGGQPNGVGTFSFIATAKDKAGNTTTQMGSYKVIYRFDGFLQPINDTAHQIGLATSIFKGGSTVPTKFQLMKADGTVVQANSLPAWLSPAKGSATTAPVDEDAYSEPSTSGTTYRWDSTAQQYIYNWGTKGNPSGYFYRIGVTLDDGQTYYVNIGLR